MLMRNPRHGKDARFLPPPLRYSRPTRPATQTLGWIGPLISAAGAAYGASKNGGKGGTATPTGMPGTSPGGGGGGGTSVSPAVQTQVSPQISPTFQQTQSSPGAVQAATATQYQPGGQTADTGAPATPSNPLGTRAPLSYDKPGGLPASPLDPVNLTETRRFRDAGDFVRDIQTSRPFDFTPIVWIAGIGGVLIIATMFFRDRKRK